jgi:putative addiction module component (TIGR02574 family)
MHTKQQVLFDALALPPIERAELIEELFFSFDQGNRQRLDQLWATEAENRIDAFELGEFAAIPAEEVFAKLNQ